MMKYWLGALAMAGAVTLEAQSVSGYVTDAVSHAPLPGANVQVVGSTEGASTDSLGYFFLEGLPPGRLTIAASFVGYQTQDISELWVKVGKTTSVDFELEARAGALEEIMVVAEREVFAPGKILITEEQINRFAATYYDPARLVTSSPDVAVTNDQNNRVSVRGISPSYNTWRLEGAEIVNPNHLSNAGTFLDQPTPTGGGVNMLSAQMLNQSAFHYSAFGSEYGNSVGGIFDMQLRSGNQHQRQYTAQASLIGLDIATEGPFRKGGRTTYAANYRYSFTGLLTQFGVDFGGESIGFQDLAFNITHPIGRSSELKVFGVGGLSFNRFEHRSFEESEEEKHRSDIDFDNATGMLGASFTTGFRKSSLSFSAVYSGNDNLRTQQQFNNADEPLAFGYLKNELNHSILSTNTIYRFRLGQVKADAGLMANRYRYESSPSSNHNQYLLRPFVNLSGSFTSSLFWELGGAAMVSDQATSIDPRFALKYLLDKSQYLQAAAGRYTQLLSPYNYYYLGAGGLMRDSDEQMASYRYALTYGFQRANYGINAEAFYYDYPNVHVEGALDEQARTYGLSMMLERRFVDDYYFRAGASLFSSTVGQLDHSFNTNYNLSGSLGREWDRSKGDKSRQFAVNLRGMYQGGRYHYNDLGSQTGNDLNSPGANFNWTEPYRTKDYLRFDLRVVWTRIRENSTSSLAIDLQNVAGIKNEAYQYYDDFTDQTETQYQLGLIPILAYRVEW